MVDINKVLLLWFTNFLIEKSWWFYYKKPSKMKNQLKNYTNELFENLKKRKAYSSFKGNISVADLADM